MFDCDFPFTSLLGGKTVSCMFPCFPIKVKTKKITTMKDVCIPGHHRLRPLITSSFTPQVFDAIEKIYRTLETMFHQLFKHLEFRKKSTPLRVLFSILFSVFGYPYGTLSLVFDILLKMNSASFGQREPRRQLFR